MREGGGGVSLLRVGGSFELDNLVFFVSRDPNRCCLSCFLHHGGMYQLSI